MISNQATAFLKQLLGLKQEKCSFYCVIALATALCMRQDRPTGDYI